MVGPVGLNGAYCRIIRTRSDVSIGLYLDYVRGNDLPKTVRACVCVYMCDSCNSCTE